jgi:hypothetical protein
MEYRLQGLLPTTSISRIGRTSLDNLATGLARELIGTALGVGGDSSGYILGSVFNHIQPKSTDP